MWLFRTPLTVMLDALRGYPWPPPSLPDVPKHKPTEPQAKSPCLVLAFHPGGHTTHHGPFAQEADAEAWARAHLKFSAKYGWEIEPLYRPEQGGSPAEERGSP